MKMRELDTCCERLLAPSHLHSLCEYPNGSRPIHRFPRRFPRRFARRVGASACSSCLPPDADGESEAQAGDRSSEEGGTCGRDALCRYRRRWRRRRAGEQLLQVAWHELTAASLAQRLRALLCENLPHGVVLDLLSMLRTQRIPYRPRVVLVLAVAVPKHADQRSIPCRRHFVKNDFRKFHCKIPTRMGAAPSQASPSQTEQASLAKARAAGRMDAKLELAKCRRELSDWRRQASQSAELAAQAHEELAQAEAEREMLRYMLGGLGAALLAGCVGGALWARGAHARLERLSTELRASTRRAESELERARRFGGERLAKALVPVSDNLDSLLSAAAEAPDDGGARAAALLEGAQLTQQTLLNALSSQDVNKLTPAAGSGFDPHTMEALFTVPVSEGSPPELRQVGLVATLVRPGFLLHERVLRAAQVGVTAAAGGAADGGREGAAASENAAGEGVEGVSDTKAT